MATHTKRKKSSKSAARVHTLPSIPDPNQPLSSKERKELQKQLHILLEKDTIAAAKALLGCMLIHDTPQGRISGMIVETEAYLCDDPACHAARGETPRNSQMFKQAGTSYVYFTYGMHYCFNIVTRKKGIGEAVLIRAIEPLEGIELMKDNRNVPDAQNTDVRSLKLLCSGPAKLCQAFDLDKRHNGLDLFDRASPLRIARITPELSDHKITITKRIGISMATELPLRFYIRGSEFISRK